MHRSLTEGQRRNIFVKLEQAHGEEVANHIMHLLPMQPHHELVTRTDQAATTTMLRGEMAELRADLHGQMAELRGDFLELPAAWATTIHY